MEILRLENVTFGYPQAETPALAGVSLSVRRGEFVLLCGESGCGKTTLFKRIKRELAPAGRQEGRIYYKGVPQEQWDACTAGEIGYVFQNPDNQIVTDKVWHELAFGPENQGLPAAVIRRRVGEAAGYFGLQSLFRKNTDELSGGQKQLLNLAAVTVMQPQLLLLDEPTGQLDPIAAAEFLAVLQKLNRELGLTVIMAEHRLEEAFSLADRVVVMERGRVLLNEPPQNVGAALRRCDPHHPLWPGLPAAVRIYSGLPPHRQTEPCPLNVREGRDFLESRFTPRPAEPPVDTPPTTPPAAQLSEVWFRYGKEEPDVLRGLTLSVHTGEHYCLLGGNGSGKTTALRVLAGLEKPYRGQVKIAGRPLKAYRGHALYEGLLALLPQNPQTVFVRDTVEADLADAVLPTENPAETVAKMAEKWGITPLLARHPYDLSGGEQQKCALVKLLLRRPTLLLLDEPTKGLDAAAKAHFQGLLAQLKTEGVTVVTVTHDVEFAAACADRCALLFDGEVLSQESPVRFFSENAFYTTAASRMARGVFPYAVTCEQVLRQCLEDET